MKKICPICKFTFDLLKKQKFCNKCLIKLAKETETIGGKKLYDEYDNFEEILERSDKDK